MNFYITVNNKEIEAVKGETILQTLRRSGISIPTLCNMDGFSPTGACRLCVVEVAGIPDLVPACSHQVEEWMDVQTHTPRVIKARKMIVELLLSGHPDDCLYCERNGHCELQNLAFELNIRERKHSGKKGHKVKDLSSPAIVRDPSKCILCGRCVRICEEVMACSALEFSNKGNTSGITTTCAFNLNDSSCITCGQCILVCPTSALYEKKHLAELQAALGKTDYWPIALVDPVASITLAEKYGNKNLRQAAKQLNAMLKKCGFKEIYDYSSVQDLYIQLVADEIIAGDTPTLFSANCPAWVKYAEQNYHHILPWLSKVKSPQQLTGAIINKHPELFHSSDKTIRKPFLVSISPCTARKFEAQRKEFCQLPYAEVDLVITTRALEQFINLNGLNTTQIEAEEFSKPFHTSSHHGEMAGLSGGTMEAVAAAVYHKLTQGKELTVEKSKKRTNTHNIKEIEFSVNKKKYKFAAVSGIADALAFLDIVIQSPENYTFVEMMACPNGCVNGGGSPIDPHAKRFKNRQKQLAGLSAKNALTACYRNRTIDEIIAMIALNEGEAQTLTTQYYPRTTL